MATGVMEDDRYSDDLHFSSWHDLIREMMGYYDRSEFEGGNDNLVEYWMSVRSDGTCVRAR